MKSQTNILARSVGNGRRSKSEVRSSKAEGSRTPLAFAAIPLLAARSESTPYRHCQQFWRAQFRLVRGGLPLGGHARPFNNNNNNNNNNTTTESS